MALISCSVNEIAAKWRHYGQRVTLGFIVENGDEFVAVGILAFDILQRRSDSTGQIAALDVVAGQAIALVAIESKLLALRHRGLRRDRATDHQG